MPGGDVLDRIRFERLRGPTLGCGEKHTACRDGAVARRIALPVCVAWLLPVCVSIVLVRAACPETPCSQGLQLQAVAASARPGPTRLDQVRCSLPHESLLPRLWTGPIDVRLRGGACALVVFADPPSPWSQEALLLACAASVNPGHTQAAQVDCGWLAGQMFYGELLVESCAVCTLQQTHGAV